MRNVTGEKLEGMGLATELVAVLRRRAHRRGMSIEQALSVYLTSWAGL